MLIGYARVSTKRQGDSLDTQRQTLEDYGCEKVFTDTISGARSARPGLDEALEYMREGDVPVVTRLDRLGRSLAQMIYTITYFAKRAMNVNTWEPALDSSTAHFQSLISCPRWELISYW